MYACKSCKYWRNQIKCDGCVKKRNNDKHRERKKENRVECDVLKKDGYKCTNESEKKINNKNVCKKHSLNKILDLVFWSEKNSSKFCFGCKRFLHPTKYDVGKATCIDCSNRYKEVKNEIKKEDKQLCLIKDCDFEAIICKLSNPPTKNEINEIAIKNNIDGVYQDFCGKHQVTGWGLSLLDEHKKPCKNYTRGCRKILDENDKSRCKECLDKDNKQEKERRDKDKEECKAKNNGVTKICIYCRNIKLDNF